MAAIISAFALLTAALHAQVPQIINYQGRVAVGTVNFDGSGSFKFALVNAAGTTAYWTNDGTHLDGTEPAAAVALTVTKGLYSVLLGDTTLANMTAIPNSVFANSDVRLRVWFNDGTNGSQLLTPDQRLAAVGYAMVAGGVADGAITADKIADASVLGSKLADTTITFDKLVADVAQALVPTGSVMPFAGTVAPAGWVFCDGSSQLRADPAYSRLFGVIGTAHGTADGTHFNLPDYRGRFLRGVDGTAGRDPDKTARTAMAAGGVSGNNVGSTQGDELRSHAHVLPIRVISGIANNVGGGMGIDTGNPKGTTNATGGNETRPVNAYVNYIIKL